MTVNYSQLLHGDVDELAGVATDVTVDIRPKEIYPSSRSPEVSSL